MTDDVPVWFLDVDGVISPYGIDNLATHELLYSSSRASNLSVPYRRQIVDAIQQLHVSQAVEVRWLTSWEPETLTDWHHVGLGPFPQAHTPTAGRRRWWKANVVEAWLHANPGRRAIWTDDDLTHARLRGFDRDRLLAMAPHARVGLTSEHLTHIKEWLYAPGSRP